MSLDWIRAQCICDRCLGAFTVEVDAVAEITTLTPSLFDIVEDAVREGGNMGGPQTSVAKVGEGDEAYNEMLCAACTALDAAANAA